MNTNREKLIERKVRWLKESNSAELNRCTHLDQIRVVTPNSNVCEQCTRLGDTWVNLRLCMICGHVGCCDDSKNKHASKHYLISGHPIIMSFQPDEEWVWCYVDEVGFN